MLGKFLDLTEDSLTAALLGHLLHLPCELFWDLLRSASTSSGLPEIAGELEVIEYWPKWNPSGTPNTRYVEPDVFISFKEFDLIIEAKRRDGKGQCKNQWEAELKAYYNEYKEDDKPVYILALGGVANNRTARLSINSATADNDFLECDVVKCRWESLLARCLQLQRELSQISFTNSLLYAQQRTLKDIIELFEWFGFSAGRWFEDFNFKINHLGDVEKAQNIFRRLHLGTSARWAEDFNFKNHSLCDTDKSQKIFCKIQGDLNE